MPLRHGEERTAMTHHLRIVAFSRRNEADCLLPLDSPQ
jgi:hypothetical protein